MNNNIIAGKKCILKFYFPEMFFLPKKIVIKPFIQKVIGGLAPWMGNQYFTPGFQIIGEDPSQIEVEFGIV